MKEIIETDEQILSEGLGKSICRTPCEQEMEDHRLEEWVRKKIYSLLQPNKWRFVRREDIEELASKIANVVPYGCNIAIMSYDDLICSINESYKHVDVVGDTNRNSMFAVIDISTSRQVGVYIPTSKRQESIEKLIKESITELDRFFYAKYNNRTKKKCELQSIIDSNIEQILWQKKWPKKIPKKFRIIAYKNAIPDDKKEMNMYFLGTYVGKLEYSFSKEMDKMFYHFTK